MTTVKIFCTLSRGVIIEGNILFYTAYHRKIGVDEHTHVVMKGYMSRPGVGSHPIGLPAGGEEV